MPRLYAYDANEFTQKNLLEVFCHCYDNPYCLNIFQCTSKALKKALPRLKLIHAWESSKRDRIPQCIDSFLPESPTKDLSIGYKNLQWKQVWFTCWLERNMKWATTKRPDWFCPINLKIRNLAENGICGLMCPLMHAPQYKSTWFFAC